jgi:hypothetical protein
MNGPRKRRLQLAADRLIPARHEIETDSLKEPAATSGQGGYLVILGGNRSTGAG